MLDQMESRYKEADEAKYALSLQIKQCSPAAMLFCNTYLRTASLIKRIFEIAHCFNLQWKQNSFLDLHCLISAPLGALLSPGAPALWLVRTGDVLY